VGRFHSSRVSLQYLCLPQAPLIYYRFSKSCATYKIFETCQSQSYFYDRLIFCHCARVGAMARLCVSETVTPIWCIWWCLLVVHFSNSRWETSAGKSDLRSSEVLIKMVDDVIQCFVPSSVLYRLVVCYPLRRRPLLQPCGTLMGMYGTVYSLLIPTTANNDTGTCGDHEERQSSKEGFSGSRCSRWRLRRREYQGMLELPVQTILVRGAWLGEEDEGRPFGYLPLCPLASSVSLG